MTKEQFQREQMRSLRESARKLELQMLAETKTNADPRYVKDVAEWIWSEILDRKLQMRGLVDGVDGRRLNTLTRLYFGDIAAGQGEFYGTW